METPFSKTYLKKKSKEGLVSVTVRMPKELRDRLKALADKKGETLTDAILSAVYYAIDPDKLK